MKRFLKSNLIKVVLSIEWLRVIIFSIISMLFFSTYGYIGIISGAISIKDIKDSIFKTGYMLVISGVGIGWVLNLAYKHSDELKERNTTNVIFPGTFQGSVIILGGILLYKVVEFIISHI